MLFTKNGFASATVVAARSLVVASVLLQLTARTSHAQDNAPDVIRGKVTDDSSRAIVAKVMITRGPDRLTQEATTDSAGNFRVRFEQGTGDYLVYATSRATQER